MPYIPNVRAKRTVSLVSAKVKPFSSMVEIEVVVDGRVYCGSGIGGVGEKVNRCALRPNVSVCKPLGGGTVPHIWPSPEQTSTQLGRPLREHEAGCRRCAVFEELVELGDLRGRSQTLLEDADPR